MKVLFIYTREFPQSLVKPLLDFEAIQFGISSISSYLKHYGHQTKLLVLTRESDFSTINLFIKGFRPELICFTAVASEYAFVEKIGRYIKTHFSSIFLMVGGVHVSLRPDDSMLDIFDACCIGEGEAATLEVVAELEMGKRPHDIANLWIKHDDCIEKNPPRCFISDLDSLPNVDREMWMEWIDLERSTQRPSLLLGRGCPFLCTYCCNHSLKKLAPGGYVRFRSPENIIKEIGELIELLPNMKEIYFEVETFGANVEWGLDLCSKLQVFNANREQALTFGVNFRITPNIRKIEELFVALKNSNFRFVNIGLESGSERVRREVLRRNYSNDDVIKAVSLARKNSLEVTFYNLIGLPSETIDDVKETIGMNRMCLPESHYLSIFHPYPGTNLYDLCAEQGFLPPDLLTSGKERVAASLCFPYFNKKQIQKTFVWFDYYVYKGHKSDDDLFATVANKYIQANGGKNVLTKMFIVIRDLVSPSLKLYPECNEYLFIKYIMRMILRKIASKLVSA